MRKYSVKQKGCFVILSLLLIYLIYLVINTAIGPRIPNYWQLYSEQIKVGDSYDHALEVLSSAWFDTECGFPPHNGKHYFFFGPADPVLVTVIWVRHEEIEPGHPVVTGIGLSETYALGGRPGCIPAEIRELVGRSALL